MRSRVFIASASSEDRMQIARAVADGLRREYDVATTLWTQGFPPGEYTLDSVRNQTEEVDFAVFILGPDDELLKPEGPFYVPRDNVIFELGLFVKALGKDRCFVAMPKNNRNMHLFTDYLGLTYTTYDSINEPLISEEEAVAGTCSDIGTRIRKKGPIDINKFRKFFGIKDLSQAAVVYPHITSTDFQFRIHDGSKEFHKIEAPPDRDKDEEFAHFDDLRAVSAIAELCGRMKVNVIATRDGQEQDVLQALEVISFSIGMLNGYTIQSLKIVEDETNGSIHLLFEPDGMIPIRHGKPIGFRFHENSYPPGIENKSNRSNDEISGGPNDKTSDGKTPDIENKSNGSNGETLGGPNDKTSDGKSWNYAILVRTFLHGSGGQPVPRFVCAGCDSSGTAAAGVYLKDYWKNLFRYYELCKDERGNPTPQDLNKCSLAAVLRFWGKKVESAKIQVKQLCFFKEHECGINPEYKFYDLGKDGRPEPSPEPRDTCPYWKDCHQRSEKCRFQSQCVRQNPTKAGNQLDTVDRVQAGCVISD